MLNPYPLPQGEVSLFYLIDFDLIIFVCVLDLFFEH
jgi:hypothetical protein